MPAATAPCTPSSESSMTRQTPRDAASLFGCRKEDVGRRLAATTARRDLGGRQHTAGNALQ